MITLAPPQTPIKHSFECRDLAVTYGQLRGGTMSQTVASDSFW